MNDYLCGWLIVGVLILLDYGSGLVNAILSHEVTSEKMRAGLGHKLAYILVLCLAMVLEFGASRFDFGFTVPLFVSCVVGIGLIEVTSVLENCVKLNPDLADSKILNIFAREEKNGKFE